MSYSMREPEWEPVCECRYDPVHDRMDRDDCFFHCDMEEDGFAPVENLAAEIAPLEQQPAEVQTPLKKPAMMAQRRDENAA